MHIRVARNTNNLEVIKKFYINILTFKLLGSFKNHNKYDGVFLGFSNADWHLEFTVSEDKAIHQFNEDDILVLYPESKNEYDALLKNVSSNEITFITPKNPYWIENGKMFLDPDGYRIVISSLKIKDC